MSHPTNDFHMINAVYAMHSKANNIGTCNTTSEIIVWYILLRNISTMVAVSLYIYMYPKISHRYTFTPPLSISHSRTHTIINRHTRTHSHTHKHTHTQRERESLLIYTQITSLIYVIA